MSRKRLARGDVVLTRFPFTDLKGSALRLATVERSVVVRRMGRLGPQLQKKLDVSLRRTLALE